VVEDDKVLGQMVTEILDDVGFEVATASNWRIAFEKLKHLPINFIVLDILLPEMDGFEIYANLQANPATKDIPVMLVTAWADEKYSTASQWASSMPTQPLKMNCSIPSSLYWLMFSVKKVARSQMKFSQCVR
jgi:CheY-like chemotaxis protein